MTFIIHNIFNDAFFHCLHFIVVDADDSRITISAFVIVCVVMELHDEYNAALFLHVLQEQWLLYALLLSCQFR